LIFDYVFLIHYYCMNAHCVSVNILNFWLQILNFWKNKNLERFWTPSWSGTQAGTTLWPDPTRWARMTHLTGHVPCLGQGTSPSDEHDVARGLTVLGHDPLNKAQAWAMPAWHNPNFRTSSCCLRVDCLHTPSVALAASILSWEIMFVVTWCDGKEVYRQRGNRVCTYVSRAHKECSFNN
jgi:hypothetical protein